MEVLNTRDRIARAIKEKRKGSGMTQDQFAKLLKTSRSTVLAIEQGVLPVSSATFRALMALDIDDATFRQGIKTVVEG